jgi:hypothetical protein
MDRPHATDGIDGGVPRARVVVGADDGNDPQVHGHNEGEDE